MHGVVGIGVTEEYQTGFAIYHNSRSHVIHRK